MAKSEFSCSENIVHEDAVAEVRGKMHDGEMLDTVAGFFKVLGDGTRMRIISALAVRELCVCDLAAALGMTKSAVSPPAQYPARGAAGQVPPRGQERLLHDRRRPRPQDAGRRP